MGWRFSLSVTLVVLEINRYGPLGSKPNAIAADYIAQIAFATPRLERNAFLCTI